MISVAVLVISAICSVSGHGHEIHGLPHSTFLDSEGKFHLSWNFNTSHVMFEVEVKTRGWVGLGFSYNGGMPGADIVMGWVDDTTGKTFLEDRHASSKSEPDMDHHQNYTLLSSFQNDTFTILRFIRPLDLCEGEDFKITADTIRVIWAFNDMEPGPGMGPRYHGANRGVRSIVLLNPEKSRPPMPANVVTIDLLHRDVTIPDSEDTTYWCQSFEIPKLDRKHHVIKVEAVIQPGREAEVHHIVLYACQHNDNTSVGVGHACNHPNMPPEWKTCNGVIFGWAIGGGDFYFPEHVGMPLADDQPDTPTMFLLETHYDNPRLQSGMVDSSGLRLTLTPDVRMYDAGMFFMGVTTWEAHVIPPYYKDFLSEGLCTKECLAQAMGNRTEEINIFAVMLHSHLAGRKLRLRHFRGGVEQKSIMEDNNYDFNLQEMRYLPAERILRKGDHTVTQCHYNTQDRRNLTFGGESTKEEMCIAFALYYPKISLSQCISGPIPQYHVGFVGASVNFQGKITYPDKYMGEDWKTFFAREVDWKSENERKRFLDYSLVTDVANQFHMCASGSINYPINFNMVPIPSVEFPWKGNTSMCTASANQQTMNIFILSVIAALTSLVTYKSRF